MCTVVALAGSFHLPLRTASLPPDNVPNGSAPVGVSPFSCKMDSDSSLRNGNFILIINYRANRTENYRKTEKTRAILPIARILLRITSLRALEAPPSIKYLRYSIRNYLFQFCFLVALNLYYHCFIVITMGLQLNVLGEKSHP